MPSASIPLACPRDASVLASDEASYVCRSCDSRYPIEDGVVRFLPAADEFYEGRYLYTIGFVPRRETLLFAWPLWLVNCGWLWAVRRHVPAGSTVVEMGCASGVAWFARRYRMIGLDLSASSLTRVSDLYATCLQADVTERIPLPDASADAVISSFVWEHIPPERKPLALAECARILRPGGALVFLYDVESEGPLYRRMKQRDPALYREILIAREGHLGWQGSAENRALFEDHGFEVREHRGREKLLISPAMYDKVRHWGGGLAGLARVGLAFRSGPAFHAYNALTRVFDETLGRLLPESWSRVVVSVCRKR
jgi:SAM-dependent methyltransferase